MKLTLNKLKILIEEVINEAAKGITDLPEDVFVTIAKGEEGTTLVYYSDKDGKQLMNRTKIYGVIVLSKPQMPRKFPCSKGLMVSFSEAEEGYGPLLYDVAMEVATIKGGGMVADRVSVSNDAYKIWDYYMKKRSDVNYSQLDNEFGDLTPEIKEDDCLQGSSEDHQNKSGTWKDSPLSKIYTKSPMMIDELEKAGKLIKKMKI
jgi:hypothetical protein